MTVPAVTAPAATVPMLELDDVSASYTTYRALFSVSLTVPANGIVALVGSNGAGKSTLARVATGLVPASKGTIRVAGEDVTRMSAHRIAQRGVTHVPEGRAVFSTLSVEENLTVSFLKRVGRKAVPDALARAYDAFPVLAERRRQLGGTLSGGQQRILSLAKVLAVAPKLLVVDELSLGLAPVIVDQVYDGLVAIHAHGSAVLVVEQQVDRALAIADRAVLLVKGAVAWDGPARDAKPVLEAQMLSGHASNGTGARNGTGAGRGATVAFAPPAPAAGGAWISAPPSRPAPPPAPGVGQPSPAPPPPEPPAPGAASPAAPPPRRPRRMPWSKVPAPEAWNGVSAPRPIESRPIEPSAGRHEGNGEAPPGLWVTGPWS